MKIIAIFYPIRLDSSNQIYLEYLWSDIPIFFFISLFFIIYNLLKIRVLKLIVGIILLLTTLHFYIDTILIYYFQSRAFIPEIFEFISYGTINSFFQYWILALFLFILVLGLSFFLSSLLKFRKKDFYIFTIILFIIYISCYFLFSSKIDFKGNILTLNPIFRIANGGYYKPECKTKYINQLTIEKGEGKQLNIILVFLESFSAIDSKNAGGNNHLPNFDKIQDNGILYTNFLSNGGSSCAAHVSTLYGIPHGRDNGYNKFNHIMDPLPQFLDNQGYNTIFISAADTSFLNQRNFLLESGFKKIIGEEEFESFPHYTFSSAPDEYLYERSLKEINYQTGKFFIGMQTISTHKPYNCPYGETESLCLKYSDEKLFDFYNKLSETDFFKSGILILVSDHRMMNPEEPFEIERLGESRQQRIVATVIGSGIDKGYLNKNIIQHTDIYNSIKKLVGSGEVQLDKYYNNIFTNDTNRNWSIISRGGSSSSMIRYDIYFQNGKFLSLNADQLDTLDNDLYEYICSTLSFHDEKLDNILKIH